MMNGIKSKGRFTLRVAGFSGASLLAAGSLLAAAVLLLPAAARAADECRDIVSSSTPPNAQTCSAAAYATGILYWDEANPVALTVTAPEGGTTITAAGTVYSGIVISTTTHASEVRNVELTVGGGGGGAVTIARSGSETEDWRNNRGIFVFQQTGSGSTTTVNVRHGVTIGSSDAKFTVNGIHVRVANNNAGAGDVTIDSAAAIYSTRDAIKVDNPGAGGVSVTNSGVLDTEERGIFVRDTGSAGDVTITNSGAITLRGEAREGIFASTTGKDSAGANAGVSVTHSAGAIAVASGGEGIKAHVGTAREETDTAHDDYVAPENAGLARVSVRGGSIRSKFEAIEAINYEAGGVEVSVSSGVTLTSTDSGGIHAELTDAGNASGAISIINAGTIRAPGSGISSIIQAGSGSITMRSTGALEVGGSGFFAVARGAVTGDISITNSGSVGTAAARASRGVFASHDGEGATGAITVANSGDIMASEVGILAQTKFQDDEDASDGVTVTHSAGVISVAADAPVNSDRQGIVARIGNWRRETEPDHDDYVEPKNTGLVRISVTGGRISAKGSAVEGANYEAGSVEISLSEDAELTSTHENGIEAELRDVGNARGTISISAAGEISAGGDGVSAKVARSSAGAYSRPVIDIVWTGAFESLRRERLNPLSVAGALGSARSLRAVRETRTGEAGDPPLLRYAQANAGIDAGVMRWEVFSSVVSAGDDPGAFADAAAVTTLFDDSADAATRARADAILAGLRSVLANEALGTIPGADAVDSNGDGSFSDAEIEAYLSVDSDARRTLLRNVLAQTFNDHEIAVFRALMTGGDLTAALNDSDAAFSDDYKAAVRALVGSRNEGDIRIAVNGGSISDARGDGIAAYYAIQHDDNGGIAVSVAEGAVVTGAAAGIYAANAGAGMRIEKRYAPRAVRDANPALTPDDFVTVASYPDQIVRVNGTVTGGTDAAVHLAGGGALIVGETGRLVAGSSGVAVLVNDPGPAIIYIGGEVRGGLGPTANPAPAAVRLTGGGTVTVGLTGVVDANGASRAIQGDAETAIVIHMAGSDARAVNEAGSRVRGAIGGAGAPATVIFAEANASGTTGFTTRAPLDSLGELDLPPVGFQCGMATDRRCELYEAAPAFMLSLNRLPTYAERMSAPRGANGVWGRVEGASGEWTAEEADSATDLSYDYGVFGGRAGFDFASEGGRFGFSAHLLRGEADMKGVGETALSGVGVGASITWLWGAFHLDLSGHATWLDAEFDSDASGKLEKDASGSGMAVGVEVGRRGTLLGGALAFAPRAGLVWSNADLGDFTDSVGSAARVSVGRARSLKARMGITLESGGPEAGGGLFLSADVEREFSDETSVEVGDVELKAKVKPTTARLGAGGALPLGAGASLALSGHYETSGSGANQYGGSLTLSARF